MEEDDEMKLYASATEANNLLQETDSHLTFFPEDQNKWYVANSVYDFIKNDIENLLLGKITPYCFMRENYFIHIKHIGCTVDETDLNPDHVNVLFFPMLVHSDPNAIKRLDHYYICRYRNFPETFIQVGYKTLNPLNIQTIPEKLEFTFNTIAEQIKERILGISASAMTFNLDMDI